MLYSAQHRINKDIKFKEGGHSLNNFSKEIPKQNTIISIYNICLRLSDVNQEAMEIKIF